MPRRPPKKWWKKALAKVKKAKVKSPRKVVGALWYRKMSRLKKIAALKKERKYKPGLIGKQKEEDTAMKKARRKRKMSAAQRAALAKGRAIMKAKRKTHRRTRKGSRRVSRYIPKTLEPIIIKEGTMSGRKRKHHRKARKSYGFEGVRKHHRARRHHRRLRGDFGIGKVDIMGTAQDVAGLAVGAVGSSFVANMIPIKDAKIKAIVPIALGIGLGMTKFARGRLLKGAAAGAIAVGTLSLVKQFFPTLPLLSGAEDAASVAGAIDALNAEEKALLGLAVDGEGMEGFQTFGSEAENYVGDASLSPADL